MFIFIKTHTMLCHSGIAAQRYKPLQPVMVLSQIIAGMEQRLGSAPP